MAFEDRSYSGNAVPATITANITNTDTSIPISASTGWPDGTSGPFFIRIDSEVIRCSGRTDLTLSVQTVPVNGRGWDNTTAASHIVPAVVEHVFTATDADESNRHYSDAGLDHHTQYLTVGRHDISARHGFGVLPTAGTPSTSVVGDTASTGASNNVARVDHKHAREVFGSPVRTGPVNGDGTATSVPRSDHLHAGGVPIIADSASRPSSPATNETIIQADTFRMMQWTGSRWQRGPAFSGTGRTGCYVGRAAGFPVPSGGATSYILPWSTEFFDSDGYIPTPDGTTTYTLTVPSLEVAGIYIVTAHIVWQTFFPDRSYIELIHTFSGPGTNQHRVSLTGEDRGTISASLDLASGDIIQLGLWQNSGSDVDVVGYLTMYRLFG